MEKVFFVVDLGLLRIHITRIFNSSSLCFFVIELFHTKMQCKSFHPRLFSKAFFILIDEFINTKIENNVN